jgi:hypothetical protein
VFRNAVDFARDEVVQVVKTGHALRVINACNDKTTPTMKRWVRWLFGSARLEQVFGILQTRQCGCTTVTRAIRMAAASIRRRATITATRGSECAGDWCCCEELARRMRDKISVQRRVAGCREGLMARNPNRRDQQKQKKRKDLNRRWETRELAKGGGFWRCVEES